MAKKEKFYVTTPIYYTNSEPHVGSAYTTIAADVLARWHKLLEKDVFFLTGTDEHGQKIQETAKGKGIEPKKFVDEIAQKFKKTFKVLNISNDNFIRTTDKEHEKEVKKVLQELYDKNFIYKGKYEAYYCVGCEQYKTDSDLINGKCPLHDKEPELRKEEAYLFKLSSFEKQLLNLIKSEKYKILPKKRRKEIIKFIENGLQDISISRLKERVYWGIELPFDKNHTCFVWVDAFWNYVTGLKDKDAFNKFWPPNIQLMAKDIFRVHATIWPALLLALDYKLPKTLFIHGYFTINGQKMSKSLGNMIKPLYITEKYGVDTLRYYLLRKIPFGEDGDFSEDSLRDAYNNELANKLGNLVSRVSTLAEKYGFDKTENRPLPEKWKKALEDNKVDYYEIIKKINSEKDVARFLKIKDEYLKEEEGLDATLLSYPQSMNEVTRVFVERYLKSLQLDKALNIIFASIDLCNEFLQLRKPWENSKKIEYRKYVIGETIRGIKDIAILLSPFIPKTSEKIAKTFGFKISLEELNKPLKISRISKSEVLFKKI